jgi:hypothetical protein
MHKVQLSDDGEWVEVLDDNGVLRLRICTDPNGFMATAHNANGQRSIVIIIGELGPVASFYDSRDRRRLLAGIDDNNAVRLHSFDEYGRDQFVAKFLLEAETEGTTDG